MNKTLDGLRRNQTWVESCVETERTIITPHRSMSTESHIDGRRRFNKMFEGTSNIAYEKKKIVNARLYCVSLILMSFSMPYN
jgi:hypothetical protein